MGRVYTIIIRVGAGRCLTSLGFLGKKGEKGGASSRDLLSWEKHTASIKSRRTNMACPDRLAPWTQEVSTAFAHLSKPQLEGLVLWSAGIAWSGVAGSTQISALLAFVWQAQAHTVFQRLREW